MTGLGSKKLLPDLGLSDEFQWWSLTLSVTHYSLLDSYNDENNFNGESWKVHMFLPIQLPIQIIHNGP